MAGTKQGNRKSGTGEIFKQSCHLATATLTQTTGILGQRLTSHLVLINHLLMDVYYIHG